MKKAILGKKIGMTQVFDDLGNIIPVTVIKAGPCHVIQKKTVEKDGYDALKVAFDEKRENLINKPQKGEFEKAKVEPKRFVYELKIDDFENYNIGDKIEAGIFSEGDIVDVTGTSKGKGFAGVIKRWNFTIEKKSHGGGQVHRKPGSVGAAGTRIGLQKVLKGKKMPGRMGNETKTIQNLKIVKIDEERNAILVKGAIPGPKNGVVKIKSAVKA